MFRITTDFTLISLLNLMVLAIAPAIAEETPAVVTDGKLISFTYTLSVDGEELESNADQAPLTYIQGGDQILASLEAEMLGLAAGEGKVVNLVAADAYGEPSPDLLQEVPLEQIPESARVVGTLLRAQGMPGPVRVVEITDEFAVLDANHPLAGKDLTFDVTIIAIDDAPAAAEDAPAPPAN